MVRRFLRYLSNDIRSNGIRHWLTLTALLIAAIALIACVVVVRLAWMLFCLPVRVFSWAKRG